jgi:hypothetical protein
VEVAMAEARMGAPSIHQEGCKLGRHGNIDQTVQNNEYNHENTVSCWIEECEVVPRELRIASREADPRVDEFGSTFDGKHLDSCQNLRHSCNKHTIEVSKERMKFGNELVRIEMDDGSCRLAASMKPQVSQFSIKSTWIHAKT